MMMKTLKRAFLKHDNNSLLLLARSKQTIHALTTKVQSDIQEILRKEHQDQEFRVVTINCTLNNSEAKMVSKFCQILGLAGQQGEFYTVEMINRVQEFFSKNPNISVLFLFEDIDYYVETTK